MRRPRRGRARRVLEAAARHAQLTAPCRRLRRRRWPCAPCWPACATSAPALQTDCRQVCGAQRLTPPPSWKEQAFGESTDVQARSPTKVYSDWGSARSMELAGAYRAIQLHEGRHRIALRIVAEASLAGVLQHGLQQRSLALKLCSRRRLQPLNQQAQRVMQAACNTHTASTSSDSSRAPSQGP